MCQLLLYFFFFNDTATTEIYTLSLHDALPISNSYIANGLDLKPGDEVLMTDQEHPGGEQPWNLRAKRYGIVVRKIDRKSTRLNSSHLVISYAVFCLKKKNNNNQTKTTLDSLSH